MISFMDCAFSIVSKRSSPYPRTSRWKVKVKSSHNWMNNWMSSCSSTICWKKTSFLHCVAFAPLLKISALYLSGSIYVVLFCSTDLIVYYFNTTHSWLLYLYSESWSRIVCLPTLFSFSTGLAVLGLLLLHIYIKISLLISTKYLTGILIGITLNL